jgi:transposase
MTEVLFKSYHAMKDGTQRWKHFQVLARNVQRVMTDILGLVVKEGLHEVSGKATTLLKEWEAAWRFIEKKGIEPTNNEAEQVIRRGVLWRKGSYGTKSETGNRYVERILSFIETMKRRGIAVFDELVKVVKAKEQGLTYRLAAP